MCCSFYASPPVSIEKYRSNTQIPFGRRRWWWGKSSGSTIPPPLLLDSPTLHYYTPSPSMPHFPLFDLVSQAKNCVQKKRTKKAQKRADESSKKCGKVGAKTRKLGGNWNIHVNDREYKVHTEWFLIIIFELKTNRSLLYYLYRKQFGRRMRTWPILRLHISN